MLRSINRKGTKIFTTALFMSMFLNQITFAGEWKSNEKGRWYENHDGTYKTNGWQSIDSDGDGIAELYYFDENGYLLTNTRTPAGSLVNEEGMCYDAKGKIYSRKVHTDNVNYIAPMPDDYPLKGRVEKYFGVESETGLVWYWTGAHVISVGVVPEGMTGMVYVDQKAVEDKDPSYFIGMSGFSLAVLGRLAGYPVTNPYSYAPETEELLGEVIEFMNSFDWRNASDLEKATRICERIQQASYDWDAANEALTTGWSESLSYGAYGCLVKGKAVCQGYAEAANLLGMAVGIKTMEMGDVGHTYPLFLVDGIWLGNEPTTQDKYFVVEDVYRKNVIGTYQQLGQYCEATGYTVPTDISQLPDWNLKLEQERFGEKALMVYFSSLWK